ncbi:hypothetical protein N6L24_00200 [Cognatishimia sp. SS12]|uniref:hypothetical protein n=1 Tax=Cognatishimia sp. SS12 TaxID=2979465 RepID=UPI00232AAC66|nr:hypothetical protein [Cognatishimia sp. SS12]MDC0736687.1 hypothetical protein [Cognatishimia sp. SS12]
MADKDPMDDMLNNLFEEARGAPDAAPGDDLMARVLADAIALQPVPAVVADRPRRSLMRAIFDAVGGWQGTSGLVAATMASVWIGFAGTDTLTLEGLQAVVGGDTDYYLSDLGGDFSFTIEEG